MGNPSLTLLLVVMLLTAAVFDFRRGRIPNWVTFPSMAAGLGVYTLLHGLEGLLFSLKGLALGIGLLLVFYMAGGMGAGDVKLLGAVGGLTGPGGVFAAFVITALLGGIYAIFLLVRRTGLAGSFRYVWSMLTTLLLFGKSGLPHTQSADPQPKIRYGLVIALGTILSRLDGGGW